MKTDQIRRMPSARGYKFFFMLNLSEIEMYPADKC